MSSPNSDTTKYAVNTAAQSGLYATEYVANMLGTNACTLTTFYALDGQSKRPKV